MPSRLRAHFNAFRIEGSGWIDTYKAMGVRSVMADRKYWIVPGINFPLKVELINRRQARATRSKERNW
jgi:hypothetical protein